MRSLGRDMRGGGWVAGQWRSMYTCQHGGGERVCMSMSDVEAWLTSALAM